MIHWKEALELETLVAQIIQRQEENGVAFHEDKAALYVDHLESERTTLYNDIRPNLETEILLPYKEPINKPFLKKGGYSKSVYVWAERFNDLNWMNLVGGPFTRVEFVDPDIGSRQKLIKQLLKNGWKPTIFTEKGQPKLTVKGEIVESLLEITGTIGKKIALWYTLGHRQSQIIGWIRSIRPDGRITAGADSCGTNTVRMRHRCVVNVPKADPKVIFGYEMRSLFIAALDYLLCGHDASGLEARIMAHYTTPYDGGEFARDILDGKLHGKNARIFYPEETEGMSEDDPEFTTYRSRGKNGFYGLVYGAQPPKLASTLGVPSKVGRKLFDSFWEGNYALGVLRDKIIKMAESRGWVPGLDGRKIYIRSSHSALNALFQSAGAIIMKRSMVILDSLIQEAGITARKVLDQHDEAQAEIPRKDVEYHIVNTKEEASSIITPDRLWSKPVHLPIEDKWSVSYTKYGELAVNSIVMAGTYYNLRCPLDAEYKVGANWACTH
ncbi:MAG: hypothetical protein KDC43_29425 [Saprospiraceae bacterium]|nr:hypothetical protein [Saprospiraceae bacterium]